MRALACSAAVAALLFWPTSAMAQGACDFVLGFRALRDLIGVGTVGNCQENQRSNPTNGNAEQRTVGGLMVWRKADNWTAFTDGYRTWLSGPLGLQSRLNTETFDWEGGATTTSGPTTLEPIAPVLPVPAASPAPSVADIAARVQPSVVLIRTATGTGSGVKVAQGVLTNAHVLGDAKIVEIVLANGQRSTGTVGRVDTAADLALLSIDQALPPLTVSLVRDIRQGDLLLALGYPRSSVLGTAPTLTTGVLSAVRRDSNGVVYAQTNAAISPGSSGGALLNERGELVGITTQSVVNSEGLNLAVAGETINGFLSGMMITPAATSVPTRLPTPSPVPVPARVLAAPAGSQLPKRSDMQAEWYFTREDPGQDSAVLSMTNWPGAPQLPIISFYANRYESNQAALAGTSQNTDEILKSTPDRGYQIYEIQSPGPAGSRAVMRTNGLVYQFYVLFTKGPYALGLTVTGNSTVNPSGIWVTWSTETINGWLSRINA